MTVDDLKTRPWFKDLMQQIDTELFKLKDCEPDRRQALITERDELDAKCRGWLASLSKLDVDDCLSQAIANEFRQANERKEAISTELAQQEAVAIQSQRILDPELVLEHLQRLDQVLASNNPSAANLMLSHHIEGIYCNADSQVVVRTCKLGALAGAIEMMPRSAPVVRSHESVGDQRIHIATPRKRTRLDVAGAIECEEELQAANQFATNPDRFAGLGPEWFTEDVLRLPRKVLWAEAHAREVAEYRLQTHASMEVTAKNFKKSIPLIRDALKYAKELGLEAFGKTVSYPTRRTWVKENAAAVAAYFEEQKCTLQAAAVHFGRSEPTIKNALDLGRTLRE